jgi:hypothetical protein
MNPLFLYVLLLNIDLGIQKINARSLCSLKAPRKSGKGAKGDYSLFFEVVFFAGFLYPFTPSPKAPTSGALNPYNLCLGYQSVNFKALSQRSLLAVRTI